MNLNQITVPSVDVGKAVAFYKKLGLKLIVLALPKYARFECPDGDATFSIHKVNSVAKGEGVTVYFEEEEIDAYVNDLEAKGVVFDQLPTDAPYLWREAKLKDPDGNQLIIFYGGDNRKNPPWRIN
jgi:predicted enzyme related to lactoylglutathione lyase